MCRAERDEQAAPELEDPNMPLEVDHGVGVVAVCGAIGLAATKAVDIATTVIGLGLSPAISERNPIAAAAIAQYGIVPGLLAVGILTVSVTVVLIECGFGLAIDPLRDADGSSARVGRALCYGVGCGCNLAIVAHNVAVIANVAAVRSALWSLW